MKVTASFILDILLILAAVVIGLLAVVYDVDFGINAEAVSALQASGWAMVPVSLVWLLLRLASIFPEVRLYLLAYADERKARAGQADADMWNTRHITKIQRADAKQQGYRE